jgi:hypothetical protein
VCFLNVFLNTTVHGVLSKSFRSPSRFYLLTAGVEVVYFHLITLRHTPQSVGLLWTRDRSVAETSTWQHKHCTRDKHPCPRWDSNPRSQQAFGRKPTPQTVSPLGSAQVLVCFLNGFLNTTAQGVLSNVEYWRYAVWRQCVLLRLCLTNSMHTESVIY